VLEGLRQRVGLLSARFQFRKSRDPVLNFPEAFARSRRALVIFPESPSQTEASTAVVKFLAEQYGNDSVVVVARKDLRPALASAPFVTVLTYDPKRDLNAWFIPRKALIRRTVGTPFDLVVDLNVGLTVTSAFLCRRSEAPIRLGFVKDHGDRFYNVQVQPRDAVPGSLPYRELIRCLEMFERS
jgi:ADP-heptose:LPS heptosyltransferase